MKKKKINAGAINVVMLIIGRLLLFGIGFTFQLAPVYLSETAPAKWRCAIASSYNAFSVTGPLYATVTKYITNRVPGWGWCVSLSMAASPGAVLVAGAFFVPDTPGSLVLRGQPDKAQAALQCFGGPDTDVNGELKDIVRAVDEVNQNEDGAFRRLFSREYRHCLAIGVAIPVFYELTGTGVISIFSPVLFRTVGLGSRKAILGSTAP
ncbi:hypothetical protein EJB05_13479, partial [Eragrostis curvula]